MFAATKLSIPRGRRNDLRQCWDEECEYLYQIFLHTGRGKQTSTTASASLSRLEEKRKDRLSEAANFIDFTLSRGPVLTTINYLTGRTRYQRSSCLISTNFIALQLVQNGGYKTKDRKSARLVMKEVSEFWRIPTSPDKRIFGDFSPKKFAVPSAAKVWKSSWP